MPPSAIADPTFGAALEPWLWGAAIVTLGIAIVVGALETRGGQPARLSLLLAATAAALIAALGLVLVAGAPVFATTAGSVLVFTPVDVAYDPLSGIFLVGLGLVGVAASIAGLDAHAPANPVTGAAYPLFLLSLLLVFGSADGFAFLLAWELMALASATLVVGARPSPEQRSAGYLYLALTHLATAALVVAFAVLTAGADGSLAFAAWPAAAAQLSPLGRDFVFILLVIGFATKAGAVPFHVWLPRAHPAAPAHVSALMSGVMIKAGIFGLVRLGLGVLGPGPDAWGIALIVLGSVSAVLGILYALMERDLKRLLAQSSIENIGIILLGLGIAMILASHGLYAGAAIGLAAALFHVFNHGLFKGLLFLGAGAVQGATGTRDLNRLGGLVRVMPLTALLVGIGAAAISGLPPLNGFSSEWLTFQSLIGAGGAIDLPPLARSVALLAVGVLALTVALTLACFVKVTGMSFLALPRSAAAASAVEAPRTARAAIGGLAILCVAAGVLAGPITTRLVAISSAVLAAPTVPPSPITLLPHTPPGAGTVAPLMLGLLAAVSMAVALLAVRGLAARRIVRRVPTWTTGILPQATMEYTATSYSKPIRLFFRAILRPDREVQVTYRAGTVVPSRMEYRGEITQILDSFVFGPLHELSIRGSSLVRRLQNGSLQVYLAYTMVAIVALLLLVAVIGWPT